MIKNAYKRFYLKGAGAEAEIPAPGYARLQWWFIHGGDEAPGKTVIAQINWLVLAQLHAGKNSYGKYH